MDTFTLECVVLPFDFSMIGKLDLEIPTGNLETNEFTAPLNVALDEAPIEIYCVRWSHHPDLLAGTPVKSPDNGYTAARARANARLRLLYQQKGIPWPE